MKEVWLLYQLWPCSEWLDDPHGASGECDCWDFLQGVFSTAEKAKEYISHDLDRDDVNLDWQPYQLSPFSACVAPSRSGGYYLLDNRGVDGELSRCEMQDVEAIRQEMAAPYN